MDITKTTYERDEVVEKYYLRYQKTADYFEIDIPKFAKNLKGKRLLDVGCGPGQFALMFANLGLKVTGIDYSKAMIKKAKSLAINKDNPKFMIMDMREIGNNLSPNSFDVVWATASLLHLNKTEVTAVLKAIHKILVDKGQAYVLIKSGDLRTRHLIDKDLGENVVRKFSFWNEKQFEKLLKQTGFDIRQKRTKSGSIIMGKRTNWVHYIINK